MTQLMTEQGIVKVPAGTWKVDQSHSSVAFEVKHMMISTVRGLWSEYDGLLEAQEDPEQSTVTGWAAAASIDTGNADRDAHLRGPDFFDADRYPRLSFVSAGIRHLEGGTYAVTGDLTIKSVTREITVEASVQGTGEDPVGQPARRDRRARLHRPHRLRPHLAVASRGRRAAGRRGGQPAPRPLGGPRDPVGRGGEHRDADQPRGPKGLPAALGTSGTHTATRDLSPARCGLQREVGPSSQAKRARMAVLVRRRDLAAPPIQRYQPFPEIHELQEQLGQLMEHVMSAGDGACGSRTWTSSRPRTRGSWKRRCRASSARTPTLRFATPRSSSAARSRSASARECCGARPGRVGRFEFRVTLPGQTDPEQVEANLEDGVLTVRIPKPEAARPRRVEVRSSQAENGQATTESAQEEPAA
jgi:polyisoprenoid-binding protein YceI